MATLSSSITSRSVDASQFAMLLAEWNRHQDVRATSNNVAELATSRFQLEDVRFEYHRAA